MFLHVVALFFVGSFMFSLVIPNMCRTLFTVKEDGESVGQHIHGCAPPFVEICQVASSNLSLWMNLSPTDLNVSNAATPTKFP